MAYRLYVEHRYADALILVEQAERIDPRNRDARVLKFRICEQQRDLRCVTKLGKDWQAIAPGDGLGPAMQAYAALNEGRDSDFIPLVKSALYLPGLSVQSRRVAGHAWVVALLRLGRTGDALMAIDWLDAHHVQIAPNDRRAWRAQIAQHGGRSPAVMPMPPRTETFAQGSRVHAVSESAIVHESVPPSSVKAHVEASGNSQGALPRHRTAHQTSLPQRPKYVATTTGALGDSRNTPTAAELTAIGRYAEAVALIRNQDANGDMTAETREALVLSLQAHSCESVLDLVPDGVTDPLITARQQLAAGYCSAADLPRSARHFQAASNLAIADNEAASQALIALAGTEQAMGNTGLARNAAYQATLRAPSNAYIRATYGYTLKAQGEHRAALHEFQVALSLDPGRIELLPEIAMLEQALGLPEDSARDFRKAIDSEEAIRQRQHLEDRDGQLQLYNWRRSVQMQEDRLGLTLSSNVRMDHGPNPLRPLEPIDFAQYSGTVDVDASYRYVPLGTSRPTWVIARASQQLEDASINLVSGNVLMGVGVRQRLVEQFVVLGSAEYVYRSSSEHEHDLMLRLSGSRTWGGEWAPTADGRWHYANVYADAAWMIRERSYFVVLNGEWGPRYKLPLASLKAAFMPYIAGAFVADNGGQGRVGVNRLDLGLGLSIWGWSGGDIYRAPPFLHRISLEVRQVVAGNATDRHAVQLRWALLKL